MKDYLRDYLLWRAGYRAGERPDRSKFVFRPVELPQARASYQELLKRAGFPVGQRPDQVQIMLAVGQMDLARHFGFVPNFPMPLHPRGWRSVVKRSAWGFFSAHCWGLHYVGNSETL